MLSFQEDTVDHMLADAPWEFTLGAVTKPCEWREFDEFVFQELGQASQRVHQVLVFVKRADFPAVKAADACSVTDGSDTKNYSVRRVRQTEDGAMFELLLRAA